MRCGTERNTVTCTDKQVTAACDLHLDNLRQLITWGAVAPVPSGGGRGHVRRWTFPQAMRIAVTAAFVDAGFSLKMAHTLTYCLPLDDMLSLYDPEFIDRYVDLENPNERHIKALLDPGSDEYWPDENHIGTVFIIDRCLVYADVLGEVPCLRGLLDVRSNLYYPTFNPNHFLWGMIFNIIPDIPKQAAITKVSRNSLLIHDRYFSSSAEEIESFCKKITRGLTIQIDDPEDLAYHHYVKISLAAGLSTAFRRLLGLPVVHTTVEEQLDWMCGV